MKVTENTFIASLGALGIVLLMVFLWHLGGRGLHRHDASPLWEVEQGDPLRGREHIARFGCAACHVVPGIRAPQGRVGPQLRDFRRQIYIAGMLPNTPENLIRWIREPEAIRPGTAMPTLGISEQEARDIAAYLYANP